MKKLLILTALFLMVVSSARANTTISALPSIPSPGVVLGTAALALDQNSTGTLTTYQASVNSIVNTALSTVNSVCAVTGMPTVCGSFFGFVSPIWYGGFCDSAWNGNNNFHDDSAAIILALSSGYPVYIYHCKISSVVHYQGNGEMMFSFSQTVPYDTNNFAQPVPGAIFVPNNIAATAENCAISFNGYNNVALYGINMHANFGAFEGTAALCTDHAFRASLAFADVNFFHAGNFGMSVGGPTDSTGVPVASGGGDSSCAFFGCNIQIQFSHFIFANSYFGIRANFSDSHFEDGYITDQAVAISSFNQFTGGASFNSIRIEDNFTAIPVGTSSIYLTPSGGITTGASGEIIAGQSAIWDMTNIEFETNVHPNIDLEGGNVQLFGSHMDGGPASAKTPFDAYVYISPNGGSLLMSGMVTTLSTGHPAIGLINASSAANISIINQYSVGGFGGTQNFQWLATPVGLNLDILNEPAQRIGVNMGVNIGTATPLSTNSIGGNISVGTSYAGVAAPANGQIIQGNVGIGTSSPLTTLDVRGPIKIFGYTVSTLPAGVIGMTAYVTDQTSACPAPGAALTGSGAVVCAVMYNGTAWVGL